MEVVSCSHLFFFSYILQHDPINEDDAGLLATSFHTLISISPNKL